MRVRTVRAHLRHRISSRGEEDTSALRPLRRVGERHVGARVRVAVRCQLHNWKRGQRPICRFSARTATAAHVVPNLAVTIAFAWCALLSIKMINTKNATESLISLTRAENLSKTYRRLTRSDSLEGARLGATYAIGFARGGSAGSDLCDDSLMAF